MPAFDRSLVVLGEPHVSLSSPKIPQYYYNTRACELTWLVKNFLKNILTALKFEPTCRLGPIQTAPDGQF
jgi:hypothetical protein